MSSVPPKGKHLSRITIDDVGFYYSKGCRVMPQLHLYYLDELTKLESQGKVCFTPSAILERYHINFKRKVAERVKKHVQK